MKVLHLINSLSAGGAETFAAQLTTALSEFCDVELLTYAGALDEKGKLLKSQLFSHNITYRDAGAVTYWQRAQVPIWLHRQVKRFKPDIVHVHLQRAEQLTIISTLLGARATHYVRTKHDSRPIQKNLSSHIIKNFFDAHIACSSGAIEPLHAAGYKRSVLIPNGFTPRKIENREGSRAALRQHWGIPAESKIALCIGRIESTDGQYLKAQDLIIKAIEQTTTPEDLHVIFVGGGSSATALQKLAEQSAARIRFHFTGIVSDITPYVAAADFMLMASLREGLPMTAIECACFELPLVLSNIEAFESFRKSSTLYFQPGDTISLASALNQASHELDALKTAARANGPVYRDQFSMRTVAQRHLSLYQQILSGTSTLIPE